MIYFVTFEKHVCCRIDQMVFHCEAKNAKEAVKIAKETWENYGFKPHMFHLYGHKSRIQDADLLRVKAWDSKEYSGQYVMNNFFCVDTRTWRVNGINQYGTKKGLPYWA